MELVIVEWIDVTEVTNDYDFNDKLNVDHRLSNMKTLGWLFQQSEKTLLLVQEFDDDEPRDWIAIPKVLITKMDVVQK
jgi:hypothetical protein